MKSIFFFDFDAIWSQYMLAIGEIGDLPDAFDAFNDDGFDRQEKGWKVFLYILFFLITFITQIVYLNMIIAYMSDTFDYMMEQRPILALQQQMQIMSISRMLFGNEPDVGNEEDRFLYIITPLN